MNLKSVVVLLNFLLISITAFGQYTYIQKLGSIATVALPDTPKLVDAEGIKQYVAVNENGVVFQAAFVHVNKGLKNIFSSSRIDSLYVDYLKGFLHSTKGKLIYKDKIKINGHQAIQFAFKGIAKDQIIYGHYRTVLLGDTLVSCGVLSSDLVPKNERIIKAFFDTFKVISVAELDEIDASTAAHKFGSAIGILIVVAIPLVIGLAIVFLLRKIIYKKQKKLP
nr:hypothetical protein [uncultured Mucilaginibacter sp.]